ncbi:hypothetical protein K9N08_03155, partial [Candidatus Gracilibacteria bacterium]|nr:hypothetical protein [Candidatus Gracilibacteria bacterium]MCF7856528.1 hypothetical protein [Candidatus Gracilibacteria bacterium]MCF7896851.1 hypothetical protein [Candidatus Gracilibacteria bacterium]
FSLILVLAAIVYAATPTSWPSGSAPLAAPGAGNVELGGSSLWTESGLRVRRANIYRATGNVGIGTTTPGEKLDVAGNIQASGTVCDSNGCIGGNASDALFLEPSGTTCPTGYIYAVIASTKSCGTTCLVGAAVCLKTSTYVQINTENYTCFVSGTKVSMADGSFRNIEDVKIGEKVIGKDNTINEVIGYERPTIGTRSTYLINDNVEFTGDHPFLSIDGWKVVDLGLYNAHPRGSEINPTKLAVGDILITDKGNVEVISIEVNNDRPEEEIVYDLKLNGNNTYTANGFVVHNCQN